MPIRGLPLLLLPAALATASPPDSLDGDWVGWAYFDAGGDTPIRFGFARGADGTDEGTMDGIVSGAFDLPLESVSVVDDSVRWARVDSAGDRIAFHGALQGEVLAGRVDWGGQKGDFELRRSPVPLPDVDPDAYADLQGIYRNPGAGNLIVGSRFWGELLLTDLAGGRWRTLFPTGDGRFFIGSALYVPDPVEARLSFSGDPVRLLWEEEGWSRTYDRFGFVEEPFAFESDGTPLRGTLFRPEGAGPFPAVAMLGGSNWGDRGTLRPEALIFVSFGMAVLTYDQRGFGESEGNETTSFEQTARDAAAAAAALGTHPGIRSDQVGLTGRSRGGWFAPLAASRSEQIAFLVLFVPPAVSPARQETTRRLNLLQEEGYSPEIVSLAGRLLEETWRYGRTGTGWERYLALRAEAIANGVPDHVLESDDPAPAEWDWIRLNMHYDPAPALAAVRCPVLALFGGADRNVVPSENLPVLRDALARAGNADVTLVEIPGADHGLRLVGPNGASVPLHRKKRGSEGWDTVGAWLAEHLDLAGRRAGPER